tara:strand:+ start:4551 stop:5246 length:696 start_codon:yes stop_codon:yes gene_type:complete
MTDVFISQSRPAIDTDKVIKYGLPIVGTTLQQFAVAANSLAGGRGFAHVQKTFSYKMASTASTSTVSVENLQTNPHGTSYTYDLTIPQIHPLASSVGLIMMLQCHDAGSSEPEIRIKMNRISDNAAIDRADNGDAMLLNVSNQSLTSGGKTESEYPDGLPGDDMDQVYPLRTVFCISESGAQANVATGPRALEYGNTLSPGDGVRITITTENVRIWSILAFEQPKLVIAKT